MVIPQWLLVKLASGFGIPLAKVAKFQPGDVFVAAESSGIHQYSASLVLKDTYTPDPRGGTWFGMDFSPAGDLFVCHFSADPPPYSTGPTVHRISRLDGSLLGTFGSYLGQGPESIVFDKAGHAYVGVAYYEAIEVRKFNSVGTLLDTFSSLAGDAGEIHVDLAADQKTLFYTAGGAPTIFRFDVSTKSQLASLATVAAGNHLSELRILPDGGVLVADKEKILRLGPFGNVVQAYDVPGESNWFSLTLDVDGTSFWSGGSPGFMVYKFDIASGAVLASINVKWTEDPVHAARITGLAVSGGVEPQRLRWSGPLVLIGAGALAAALLAAAARRRTRAR